MTVTQCPEYLRRNLLVASAVGAKANAEAALSRLQAHKRAPWWLKELLQGIIERTDKLPTDLAQWRDAADDNPWRGKQCLTKPSI